MDKQLRILIVEDNIADAELMERELRKGGLRFTSLRVDTKEAYIKALKEFAPDIILCDYKLPGFDGLSTLEIAKEKCPDVPFIFVSGAIGEDFAIETVKQGATDYVLKDRLARLVPAVQRALREAEERVGRQRAQMQIQRQLQRITTLRTIDRAIAGSMDLRVTFNVFLDQVTSLLRIDAADILLLNPHTQILEFAAGRGFRTSAMMHSQYRLGEGYAGKSALERRTIVIADLRLQPPDLGASISALWSFQFAIGQEGFVSYYALPLIAKSQIKGVLELFHRLPLDLEPEWLDFLEVLAMQAAIAIDNAILFEDLQHSHLELTLAYDATLEGWVKALDLRDKETEGHTQRVTEMTLRLARAMGFSERDLDHIRRGALLHDIGKIGIPDAILHKPGSLSDEEWVIMRKHPVYAYELLQPISYLRPAIDIPHCHHEKWDGTGYPRGLKGEQIPLPARIFAVVDVWDALCSDRPYRKAWEKEKVREYIQRQASAHFDPKVAETFLKIPDELPTAHTG